MNNDLYTNESVLGKVGQIVRTSKSENAIAKKWNKSSDVKGFKTIERNDITDKEYIDIREILDKIHSSDITYNEYKPLFAKLCGYAKIPVKGTIISTRKLKRGKTNKHTLIISYSNNSTEITIGADYALYHQTRNILTKSELTPQFKGKSDKGYLYDSPRVYLTIRKKMPRYAADYKQSESKMYLYRTVENIKIACVDPLVWHHQLGAVFVETNLPIKMELVEETDKSKDDKDVKESVRYESMYEFMEEYGLIDCDENVYTESIKSFIGQHKRDKIDTKKIKSDWDNIMKKFVKTVSSREVSIKDMKSLKSACLTVTSKDVSFVKYKLAFNKICKFMSLPQEDTVINEASFVKRNGKTYLEVTHSKGHKRVIIPNGVHLTILSDKEINELKPIFKSGKGLYPSPRVYFNLSREVLQDDSNSKSKLYTPEEVVRTAFIDNSYNNNGGVVYMDTKLPIPVIRLYDKIVKKLKKLHDEKSDTVKNTEED